jgi:hypothetical protein
LNAEWIPRQQGLLVEDQGNGRFKLTLVQAVNKIDFGSIPASVRIDILKAGVYGPLDLKASKAGAQVKIHFSQHGTRQIRIGKNLRNIKFDSFAGITDISVSQNGTNFEFDQGSYRISSADNDLKIYKAHCNGPKTVLSGSAAVSRLRGDGRVTVERPAPDLDIKLNGSVVFSRELVGAVNISADSINADSMRCSGRIVTSAIAVNGSILGEGELYIRAKISVSVKRSIGSVLVECDGEDDGQGIRIGEVEYITLSDEAIGSIEEAPVNLRIASSRSSAIAVVENCVLRTKRLQVSGDIRASRLTVTKTLVVTRGMDFRNINYPQLDGLVTLSDTPLEPSDMDTVGEIEEARIGADLILESGQKFVVGNRLDVNGIENGSIRAVRGKVIARKISGSDVTSAWIGVGSIDNSLVSVSEMLRVVNPTDSCEFTVLGSAIFASSISGKVFWRASVGSYMIAMEGLDEINVVSPWLHDRSGFPKLELNGHGIGDLTLDGSLRIEPEVTSVRLAAKQTSRMTSIGRCRLAEESLLSCGPGAFRFLDAAINGYVSIEHTPDDKSSISLCVSSSESGSAIGVFRANRVRISALSKASSSTVPIYVEVACREVLVSCPISLLSVRPTQMLAETPIISVGRDGVVEQIFGEFILGECQGFVSHGSSRSDTYSEARRWFPPRPAKILGLARIDGTKLTDVAEQEKLLTGGEIAGIDVTEIPFSEIAELASLEVFDPDVKTLREVARQSSGPKRRRKAEWLKGMATIVSGKATSGSTRSAALWASARAHHKASDSTEWAFRFVLRMIGYGYKIWPAFLSYVLWILFGGLILSLFDSQPTCAQDPKTGYIGGDYNFFEQIARMILIPRDILRVSSGPGMTYAPVFCNPMAQLVATIVTSFILVGLVLAIRNFLKTPSDKELSVLDLPRLALLFRRFAAIRIIATAKACWTSMRSPRMIEPRTTATTGSR